MSDAMSLEQLLERSYRFNVIADPEVGYVIDYPDLPGCMTQVDSIEEVSEAAAEIRELWIESAFEHGVDIPDPIYPETYSGKFNVRLPRSLHRRLAERAQLETVSLNQLVLSLLSSGVERKEIMGEIRPPRVQMDAPVAAEWSEAWESSWQLAGAGGRPDSQIHPVVTKSRLTSGEIVLESRLPARSQNIVSFPSRVPEEDEPGAAYVTEEIAV